MRAVLVHNKIHFIPKQAVFFMGVAAVTGKLRSDYKGGYDLPYIESHFESDSEYFWNSYVKSFRAAENSSAYFEIFLEDIRSKHQLDKKQQFFFQGFSAVVKGFHNVVQTQIV